MSRQRGESLQQYKARVKSESLTKEIKKAVQASVDTQTAVDNTLANTKDDLVPKAPAKVATPKVKKEEVAKAADSE